LTPGHESSATQQPGDARLLRGVRWRLVAWSAGSTLLLLLVLGTALYIGVQASLAAASQEQLTAQADGVSRFLERLPPGGLREPHDREPDDPPLAETQFGGPGSGTISIIVDADGQFAGGEPQDTTDLPVTDGVAAALAGTTDLRLATVKGNPVRVLSEPVEVDGQPHVIQVIGNRTDEQRTLTTLLLVLVVGGLAVLGLAAGVGFVYAGNALVPIRESLRRQREFAADASHELRTPLTIVRGNVERLRRHPEQPREEVAEALDDIETEVDHLAGLVDDLLLLARSDSGTVELRRDPIDLSEVAGEALQRLRGLADSRGVRLSLDAAPANVTGDADRLRQLVAILVDNAIRHSPPGGTVHVSISREGRPAIRVDDEGRGIRPEDMPNVFDRFWRAADAPSGGTGLGLAIAAWIAEHHGGVIQALNRPEGGARFEVRLPRT
jgi:two-component system sensor histidine kinase CiaH